MYSQKVFYDHIHILSNENLSYVALGGGTQGILKTYNSEESTITYEKWPNEKVWLDNNFSDIVGDLSRPTLQQQEDYMTYLRTYNCGRPYCFPKPPNPIGFLYEIAFV